MTKKMVRKCAPPVILNRWSHLIDFVEHLFCYHCILIKNKKQLSLLGSSLLFATNQSSKKPI